MEGGEGAGRLEEDGGGGPNEVDVLIGVGFGPSGEDLVCMCGPGRVFVVELNFGSE